MAQKGQGKQGQGRDRTERGRAGIEHGGGARSGVGDVADVDTSVEMGRRRDTQPVGASACGQYRLKENELVFAYKRWVVAKHVARAKQ